MIWKQWKRGTVRFAELLTNRVCDPSWPRKRLAVRMARGGWQIVRHSLSRCLMRGVTGTAGDSLPMFIAPPFTTVMVGPLTPEM